MQTSSGSWDMYEECRFHTLLRCHQTGQPPRHTGGTNQTPHKTALSPEINTGLGVSGPHSEREKNRKKNRRRKNKKKKKGTSNQIELSQIESVNQRGRK
jgi:hypothetical protein